LVHEILQGVHHLPFSTIPSGGLCYESRNGQIYMNFLVGEDLDRSPIVPPKSTKAFGGRVTKIGLCTSQKERFLLKQWR
jgi:hypothetical protein